MALNFPPIDQSPYFDPTSGLKYIYNNLIGAWETAIQPPAICLDTAPLVDIEGLLWWDSNDDEYGGRLRVFYQGRWVDATPTVPRPPTVDEPC